MAKRIVIMAGGTGGHVFPALAVAQNLRERGWQVNWLGTEKGLESRVVPENDIEIDWLSVAGVRGKGVCSKIKALTLLFKACLQAMSVLRHRKPDVVLGMGGFVAGPGGLMAKLLGIPLVIHEQNRVPGTTNRLLANFANRVLEAFPQSFTQKTQAICTGNPLRKQLMTLTTKEYQAQSTELKVLVIGGSQGAQVLNEILPKAMARISNVSVKHQTGTAMKQTVTEAYAKANVNAEVLAFIKDMNAVYQWADVVVCRAGAMTVSEVAAAGLPAIFVPLPQAIDDHQTANARYLVDAGAGCLLKQQDLNEQTLVEKIGQIKTRLADMSAKAKKYARIDATERVAEICIEEAVK